MTIGSAEEFYRLRSSDNPAEYRRAAREEATVETWMEVIRRYPDLRKWVAQNKTVPVEILTVLARDEDWRVRTMVAMKRKLTPELFETLSCDPNEGIRHSIVVNKKTPLRVLEKMRDDPWDTIREEVRGRLDM